MKITLGGRYSVTEFQEAVSRVISNFAENGVDEFRNVTFYLNPFRERRMIVFQDAEESGALIDHLTYDGPLERQMASADERIHVMRNEGTPTWKFDK